MPPRVIALVPFKCFTQAKRRLRSALCDAAVESIGRAMLADVLGALARSQVDQTLVLTEDAEVAAAAHAEGAAVALRSPDPGLNAALAAASADAELAGFEATLVVLGDLPLLESTHIDRVLAAGTQHGVVLVAALDGGTALLYRRPARIIQEHFGTDSAARHRSAALRAGLEACELGEIAAVAGLDLDTLEDAKQVLHRARPSHTRTALEKLLR